MKKLSFLLEAGISFLQALHFVEEKELNSNMKKRIREIRQSISAGNSIPKSFDIPPFIVDRQSLNIIESGVATGTLSKNCLRIGDDLEDRVANRERLIGALIYPVCIALFSLVLVLVLLLFVFPKILPIIISGGTELPLPTRIIIFTSEILRKEWMYILSVVGAVSLSTIVSFKKSEVVRKRVEIIFLKTPFFSKMIRLGKVRFFAKTISLFVGCGYTLYESLHHLIGFETNLVYKEGYVLILEKIRSGGRFSSAIMENPLLFPSEVAQFVSLGEESGNIAKTLIHLSSLCDGELKEIEKRIFTLLEPALMIFLGVIVGGIALSLISPIYSLTASLNQPAP